MCDEANCGDLGPLRCAAGIL